MPALRKLLHVSAAVLITLVIASGQYYETAALSSDSVGDDSSISPVSGAKIQKSASQNLVRDITPDFSGQIKERFDINDDVIGWLNVPGTNINQVILKNPFHKSNSYYLELDIKKRPDKNGCYCADFRTVFGSGKRSELSRITTIYGHSWDDNPDGSLFAQLKKYRDPEFAKKHPYIFFSTDTESMVWEVFAVFDTTIDLPYITPNLSDSNFFTMLDIARQLSYYDYYIEIAEDDKLLALSTCTYSVMGHESLPEYNDYRYAIMARLVSPDDSVKSESSFTINKDRLSPDEAAVIVKEKQLPIW